MPWKDADERRAYHKQWRLKPEHLERDRERCRIKSQVQRSQRLNLLSQFGCTFCDEIDPDIIDWHHVDPNTKQLNIKGCGGVSEERWWSEVLKCIPLCCNCHRKIHANKLCLIPIQT